MPLTLDDERLRPSRILFEERLCLARGPIAPDAYRTSLDFAVAIILAPVTETALTPAGGRPERGVISAEEAERRELANLCNQAKSSRRLVRTLIDQTVTAMVRSAAETAEMPPFDAEAWSEAWMEKPFAELYGLSPLQVILTGDGWRQVEGLVECMGGGFAA